MCFRPRETFSKSKNLMLPTRVILFHFCYSWTISHINGWVFVYLTHTPHTHHIHTPHTTYTHHTHHIHTPHTTHHTQYIGSTQKTHSPNRKLLAIQTNKTTNTSPRHVFLYWVWVFLSFIMTNLASVLYIHVGISCTCTWTITVTFISTLYMYQRKQLTGKLGRWANSLFPAPLQFSSSSMWRTTGGERERQRPR